MPSWISQAEFKQYIMKCNTHQVSVLDSITYAFEDFSNTFWWLTHDYDSWAHIVWSLKSLKLLTTVSQNCYIKSMDAIRWWFKEATLGDLGIWRPLWEKHVIAITTEHILQQKICYISSSMQINLIVTGTQSIHIQSVIFTFMNKISFENIIVCSHYCHPLSITDVLRKWQSCWASSTRWNFYPHIKTLGYWIPA